MDGGGWGTLETPNQNSRAEALWYVAQCATTDIKVSGAIRRIYIRASVGIIVWPHMRPSKYNAGLDRISPHFATLYRAC